MNAKTKAPVICNCRFGEGCTKTWDTLEETDLEADRDIARFCPTCRRHVIRALDDEDLWSLLEIGYCVAVVPKIITTYLGPRCLEETSPLLAWD